MTTEEEKRLDATRLGADNWYKWGPYLSERQWGTVREDYSEDGEAWDYLTHEQARSRAYRWGEEGIAGISDDKQQLCFAIALWNGRDPYLKERLFGLTGNQGNHGEDVKEYYFYVDNVPSHAYMKYLYKYPQSVYPYEQLVKENGRRTRQDPEYELLDTGIFDENRYFDVFVEYAKTSSEEILIQISVANRGPEASEIHLLPTLWLRNTWNWTEGSVKPELEAIQTTIKVSHPVLGERFLYCDHPTELLFTENETNNEKLFGSKNSSPYVKDGIDAYIVQKKQEAVNPEKRGTKASAYHLLQIGAGETVVVRLRLSDKGNIKKPFGDDFARTFKKRKEEADAFYQKITPFPLPDDMRLVQRQAFAGLLWNKQFYHYNVDRWLKGDSKEPLPSEKRKLGRNARWWNLDASDIFSMPDKWEYPWFASWDLAFHAISFAMIDPDFAKKQLLLLIKEWYMHPDGQIPAYEWEFSDVNPPVHAWAALRIYQIESAMYGRKDRNFLEQMFQKLIFNFTWWVNRKDKDGRNIFQGGFLGLDNISMFNRSKEVPMGGVLEQCDGTGWMGMYCLNLLQMALELAVEDANYEEMATKFFEHFIYIADAINNIAGQVDGLWDEKSGFYYGLVRMPGGKKIQLNHDSIVGIIPLFAVAVNEPIDSLAFPKYRERFQWLVEHRPELVQSVVQVDKLEMKGSLLIALASPERLQRILKKLLDENIFLSPYGIRSVSHALGKYPAVLNLGNQEFRLDYEPAESTIPLFGGNSNWRGPVWFPLNYLLIETLQKYHYYLGDEFKVECPTDSGNYVSLWDVASEINHRLIKIFLKDENGRRPVYGGIEKFQTDPYWRDYILFHEYFHGDNGAGLGASNQTGWTGLVAKLIQQYGEYVLQNKPPLEFEKRKAGKA
ncbi:MAG: glucosidase [Chlamydiota bacterium]